jgi:hypothetical protein
MNNDLVSFFPTGMDDHKEQEHAMYHVNIQETKVENAGK